MAKMYKSDKFIIGIDDMGITKCCIVKITIDGLLI